MRKKAHRYFYKIMSLTLVFLLAFTAAPAGALAVNDEAPATDAQNTDIPAPSEETVEPSPSGSAAPTETSTPVDTGNGQDTESGGQESGSPSAAESEGQGNIGDAGNGQGTPAPSPTQVPGERPSEPDVSAVPSPLQSQVSNSAQPTESITPDSQNNNAAGVVPLGWTKFDELKKDLEDPSVTFIE
jgi:hypothetical protein